MSSRREFLKLVGLGAVVVPLAPLIPPSQVNGPPQPPPEPIPPSRIIGYAQVHDGDGWPYGPGYTWDRKVFMAKQGPWPAPRQYASYTPLCAGK